MKATFSLALFSTDPGMIRRCVAAGVAAVVVSWERLDKEERQLGYDTDLSFDTLEGLQRVRSCTDATVICRVNPSGGYTAREVEDAIAAGADEILLPMVRSAFEVRSVLDRIGGRCGLGIMAETLDAVAAAGELARLPLARVYVGLNDLAIERGTTNQFETIADGTVEQVRAAFEAIPVGFAGLTLPDRGYPIPCRLLIGEMARLGCSYSFLRRSFHRDIRGRDPAREIPRLLEALGAAGHRPPGAVARDRQDLEIAIGAWPGATAPREERESVDRPAG